MLDYGYRSKCCYAPIRLGRRKIKGVQRKIPVWVCCKCHKRDVDLIEYNKEEALGSRLEIQEKSKFISEDEE